MNLFSFFFVKLQCYERLPIMKVFKKDDFNFGVWATIRLTNSSYYYTIWKRLKDISTPYFSTPSFNPRPFNPGHFNHEFSNPELFNPRLIFHEHFIPILMNHELFNPGLFNPKSGFEKSGVGKFINEKNRVEKFGVEKSRVEMSSNY